MPPMWARWVLAIVVAVAAITGIVIAIDRAGPESANTEIGAEAEINRVADIAISEDEAPRFAALPTGTAPVSALQQAITRDIRHRITGEQLTGPLESVVCSAAGAGSAGRDPYRCKVRSASIVYPVLAVVDSRRRRLTWCKVDEPATPGTGAEIPISASCKA